MAIVDDFAGIAAELRRIKQERSRIEDGRGDAPGTGSVRADPRSGSPHAAHGRG
jgi:hypothetical protein